MKNSFRKLLVLAEPSLCVYTGFSFAGAGASNVFNKDFVSSALL